MAQPPFKNLGFAVRWAHFTADRPVLTGGGLLSPEPPEKGDLNSYERRGQAAAIIGAVERLLADEPVLLAYIKVVWLRPGKLSQVAKKQRKAVNRLLRVEGLPVPTEEDVKAMETLAGYVRNRMGVGFDARRGVSGLILKYRGDGIGRASIRKDLRCDMNSVEAYYRQARDVLTELDARVQNRLAQEFYDKGWLADN